MNADAQLPPAETEQFTGCNSWVMLATASVASATAESWYACATASPCSAPTANPPADESAASGTVWLDGAIPKRSLIVFAYSVSVRRHVCSTTTGLDVDPAALALAPVTPVGPPLDALALLLEPLSLEPLPACVPLSSPDGWFCADQTEPLPQPSRISTA